MTYQELPASPPLDDFVKCFWTLKREYDVKENFESVLPDSYFELIINLGDPYFTYNNNKTKNLPTCFLLGMLTKPFKLYSAGQVQLIAARLYPWGAKEIFDDLIQNITDSILDTTFLFNSEKKANFTEELCLQTLEERLLSLLIKSSFTKDKVFAATQILYQNNGMFKIADLAKLLFTNSRTLQQSFQQNFGTSAKSVAKNFRFDKIKKTLSQNPDTSLKDLAYEYGYTDQSHFSKDFKSFTEMTPTEFCNHIKAR